MTTVEVVDYFKSFYYVFIIALSILAIPIICVVISARLLYLEGIIIDAMVLDGDASTFNLFFVVAGLSFVNLIVYLYRNRAM